MNQILQTNLNRKNKNSNSIKKLRRILKCQLYFSITLIIFIVLFTICNKFKLSKEEKYSKQILNNYNITKLYSNLSSNESLDYNKNVENTYVIGIIEIPKINIYYPIFSNCNDDLLKIAPCKFYGPKIGSNR